MPRGVRIGMHSGVSSITLLGDVNREVLARPARVGEDAWCGCPTMAQQRLIDTEYPPAIAPIYTQLAWDSLLNDLNDNLRATAVPVCPMVLSIPFFPPSCCLFWWCLSDKSKERVEFFRERVEEENQRLLPAGLLWTEPVFEPTKSCPCFNGVPELRGCIQLHMNISQRTQFELDNPQASQFLAQRLLQKAELREASKSGVVSATSLNGTSNGNGSSQQPQKASPSMPNTEGLDEAQAKLLNRQVTLVRRNSIVNSTSKGDHSDPSKPSAADANARWAEPAKTSPAFQPILPDSPPAVTME